MSQAQRDAESLQHRELVTYTGGRHQLQPHLRRSRCWLCDQRLPAPASTRKRYCSPNCARRTSRALAYLDRVVRRWSRRCPVCTAEMVGKRSDAIYCSHACSMISYRQRKALFDRDGTGRP